jgi:CBS domain-containing protein
MIAKQVRDILVPLAEYPHIARDASVRDAFGKLRDTHQSAGWRFRNLLVFDADDTLVGVLGIRDLLRALMPDYLKANLGRHYSGSQGDDSALSIIWESSFEAKCAEVAEVSVERYMAPVLDTIPADAPLTRAAYLMVAHGVDMLPVLDGARVVGVVRIVDVFNQTAAEVLHV